MSTSAFRNQRTRFAFALWAERMQTPEVAVAAIRRLQCQAPDDVQSHFSIEADGSFMLDTVWFAATKH
jgi:hypothetical protein